jgi:hypothetical protein
VKIIGKIARIPLDRARRGAIVTHRPADCGVPAGLRADVGATNPEGEVQ